MPKITLRVGFKVRSVLQVLQELLFGVDFIKDWKKERLVEAITKNWTDFVVVHLYTNMYQRMVKPLLVLFSYLSFPQTLQQTQHLQRL